MLRATLLSCLATTLGLGLLIGCDDDDDPVAEVLTEIAVVDLDLAVAGDDGYPTAEGPVLEAGVTYVLEVEGTYSIWGESMWNGGTCRGNPAPAPTFASPGVTNGPAGVDAETWFAIPSGSSLCNPSFPIPNHTGLVRMNLDGTDDFDHVEPVSGKPEEPSVDHTYVYRVVGQGHAFRVRREDSASSDDYGILRYTIYRVD